MSNAVTVTVEPLTIDALLDALGLPRVGGGREWDMWLFKQTFKREVIELVNPRKNCSYYKALVNVLDAEGLRALVAEELMRLP